MAFREHSVQDANFNNITGISRSLLNTVGNCITVLHEEHNILGEFPCVKICFSTLQVQDYLLVLFILWD